MHRTGRRASPHDASVRITSAHTSHSERIRGRQTRYLMSMGIRTVCFVLAVVTDGALRWVFIAGAVVLPYIAVVVANASGEIDSGGPEPFVDDSRRMLEAGPSETAPDAASGASSGAGHDAAADAGPGTAGRPTEEPGQ